MVVAAPVTLPRGTWRQGSHHRLARLRPLTGADEAFLLEAGPSLLPAERDTAILDRCLVGGARAGELSAGDRVALLLHLYRMSFGDRVESVVACPSCGDTLELDLPVGDLLVDPDPTPREWNEAEVEAGEATGRVRFRPPTGRELEEAGRMTARGDPSTAAWWLLDGCTVDRMTGRGSTFREAVRAAVAAAMAEVDPQAEIVLDLPCPACGTAFGAAFDPGDFLSRHVGVRSAGLYREVHRLAAAYHWKEGEILEMTGQRRRRYLDAIADATGRGAA